MTTRRPLRIARPRFEQLVADALRLIPSRFRSEMKNLALVIEDEPSVATLAEVGLEPPDSLYGLYQGTPLPERGWAHGNQLPDCITLYRRPIEEDCGDEDEVRDVIGETLIHEIGHYFGLSEEEIEAIEAKYGVAKRSERGSPAGAQPPRARKRFGQHFLEPAWVNRLINALDASATDTFLEIGPGRGALTHPLASRVGRLIAVEIDRELAARLRPNLPTHAEVVCQDVLSLDVRDLLASVPSAVRVVGNLPYNISSPILFWLLRAVDSGARITDATVMLQREVAERLTAKPGGKTYGALTVQLARAADIEWVMDLPPGAFRPAPKVDSAVVRLRFRAPAFETGDSETFETLVRGVFQHRRKTLLNALGPAARSLGTTAPDLIDKAGLDGSRRPETLSPAEFGRLAKAVL